MEQDVAEMEPGLDVVRVGAGDRVVERLRLPAPRRAATPAGPVKTSWSCGREPAAVLDAAIGEFPGDVRQRAAGGGSGETVVGERERWIGVDRRLECLHRVEVPARPQLALARR